MKARHLQAVPRAVDPTEVLSEDSRAQLDLWLAKYPADHRRSAVLAGLRIAQKQNEGHLNEDLIAAVAAYLGIPTTQAFEVATFYSLFHLGPCGRHKVSICTNISCWLNGADELVSHVEKKLGISTGDSTPDGRIHLIEEEECLAACVRAPMMWVDGEFHEHLTPEKVDLILDALK
jgi:NADH-quinone oxidoreductase subunit E